MIIGITGLIGTGKTTVSTMLVECHGAKLHDADKTVHALYQDDDIRKTIQDLFTLKLDFEMNDVMDSVKDNDENRKKLEQLLHNKVRAQQLEFLQNNKNSELLVLDIPLLFETQAEQLCDEVWLTQCSVETQRTRVLARQGFDVHKLETIKKWQGNDAWKAEKATRVINTDKSLKALEEEIATLIGSIL